MDARIELDDLINHYLHSGNSIFVDFANLLIRNHDYIINSFVMVEKHGSGKIYSSRLSNGPIESLNRKVKELKRLGHGMVIETSSTFKLVSFTQQGTIRL